MTTSSASAADRSRLGNLLARLRAEGLGAVLADAWQRRYDRLSRRWRHRWRQGLPPGLDRQLVDELGRNRFGGLPRGSTWVHLSGWKETGAFRVRLDTATGRRTFIYKNVRYATDQIPALRDLPLAPGPPEALIYGDPRPPLTPYLPEVYDCRTLEAGRHYHYLLEDLAGNFQRPRSEPELLAVAAGLGDFHTAFAGWIDGRDHPELLRYDPTFVTGLRDYLEQNLGRYFEVHRHGPLADLAGRWQPVVRLYRDNDFLDPELLRPIHGDLNRANVLLRPGDRHHMKLLDWEWAGLGLPHADLVSVFKGKPDALIDRAVELFAAGQPYLSLAEHRRLYAWVELERNLFDAAFLGLQSLENPVATRVDMEATIRNALERSIHLAALLSNRHQGSRT